MTQIRGIGYIDDSGSIGIDGLEKMAEEAKGTTVTYNFIEGSNIGKIVGAERVGNVLYITIDTDMDLDVQEPYSIGFKQKEE